MKPREWCIPEYLKPMLPVDGKPFGGEIHVIEHSAYAQLQARAEKLVKALARIANERVSDSDRWIYWAKPFAEESLREWNVDCTKNNKGET